MMFGAGPLVRRVTGFVIRVVVYIDCTNLWKQSFVYFIVGELNPEDNPIGSWAIF